jgi:hypothetical protein
MSVGHSGEIGAMVLHVERDKPKMIRGPRRVLLGSVESSSSE